MMCRDSGLDLAQEARSPWEENAALDKLCAEADITRLETPNREAP
jgi:hypothetical protein